eukprot:CAMPEP_0174358754 /NCGR_PEP_ID=MMETSP0811_2-20130205/44535_1 /TAXON_ID=73025 ORGANISM="Eutreptiella gymnastica-like, Strain CCMP1594" /NCGR_SAMPLE_ID=MMETSP0811_2 /ASSEMBLY_ACC=CAM_ASM_000667 /LENGTH=58 /DNA_ID=CAMNT_0015492809 /DNA_START=48 /DNA_END=221 /DNA_ORIENTATION=+
MYKYPGSTNLPMVPGTMRQFAGVSCVLPTGTYQFTGPQVHMGIAEAPLGAVIRAPLLM